MAWQDESIEILRVMLNDLSDTAPEFDDDTLTRVLLVAARQVGGEMTFTQPFVVDVVNQSITPDPTDDSAGSRDNSYVNLYCIKSAALIDRGAARLAAKQGILVKDGTSLVDLRGQLEGKLKLLDKGWNAVYDEEKLQYQSGRTRTAGAAIMSPFRLFAGYDGVTPYMPYEGRSFFNQYS